MSMDNTRQALRRSRQYLWIILIALMAGPLLGTLNIAFGPSLHTAPGQVDAQHQ